MAGSLRYSMPVMLLRRVTIVLMLFWYHPKIFGFVKKSRIDEPLAHLTYWIAPPYLIIFQISQIKTAWHIQTFPLTSFRIYPANSESA